MLNTKIALASLVLLSSAASISVNAQTEEDNGWRMEPEFSIGAGYGPTKIKDNDEDFDEDEAAKKIFALAKFNEYVGIEASYIDFDEAGNDFFSLDAKGKTLALILEAPINETISLYAKGGQMWWEADAALTNDLFSASDDYDGDETFWGAGVKFGLAEHLDLRIEYERFNFEISRDEIDVLQASDIDTEVDLASVNLQFTF